MIRLLERRPSGLKDCLVTMISHWWERRRRWRLGWRLSAGNVLISQDGWRVWRWLLDIAVVSRRLGGACAVGGLWVHYARGWEMS